MIFYVLFIDNLNAKFSCLKTRVVCSVGHDEDDFLQSCNDLDVVYKVVCSHSYGSQMPKSFVVTVLSSWSYGLHCEFGKLTITLLWHMEPYIYQYQSDHTYLSYICDTLLML